MAMTPNEQARFDRDQADTKRSNAETLKLQTDQAIQLIDALKNAAITGIQTESGKIDADNLARNALLAATVELRAGRNPDLVGFQAQLQNITEQNNVDRAMVRFPAGTTQVNYDLTAIDAQVFADGGASALAPELKPRAQQENRRRVAAISLQGWNPRTGNIETYITGLGADPTKVDSIYVDALRKTASERENSDFETIRTQFESGVTTDVDFRALFEGPAATITNPSLRQRVEKYYNEPTKAEARKAQKIVEQDKADKVKIDQNATQYSNLLDNGGIGDAEGIDIDNVLNNITNAPGFADLPAPVQESIRFHYRNKGERLQIQRNVDIAKIAETQSKNRLEQYNNHREVLFMWLKRLRWIGVGLAVGGIAGGFISGGAALSTTLSAFFSSNLLIGAGLGGVAGGILGNNFDKSIIESEVAANEAARKYLEGADGIAKIQDTRRAREIDALTAFTKMSALVNASVTNLNQAKLIDQYLKSAGLKDINEILKL